MPQFKKKPVVVVAHQLEHTIESRDSIAKWCNGFTDEHRPGIIITAPIGYVYAQVDDWILKDVNGEFSICKPDIFEKTYDAV